MSLAIEVDDITHVLLADGWHTVHDASFGIDSYEFMRHEGMADSPILGGGQDKHIAAAGHRGSTSRTTSRLQDSASPRLTRSFAAR
jgi:hypothetical protein